MKLPDSIKQIFLWAFSGIGMFLIQVLQKQYTGDSWNIVKISLTIILIIFTAIFFRETWLFFSRKRETGVYVKCKIREIIHFLLGDMSLYATGPYRYDVYEVHKVYKKLCLLLKEAVCNNQGMLVDYYFNGGRLHKKFKEEHRRLLSSDCDELEGHYHELEKYLDKGARKAIKMNTKHMSEYFHKRATHEPRIVVKIIDGENIADLWRAKYEYMTQYGVSENTGFEKVYETGGFFLCNDIPQDAANDKYNNPRLNNTKVRTYLKDTKSLKNDRDNERWIDCWVKNEYKKGNETVRKQPSAESCYKSTLVIPMTLINNEGISGEFREHFKIPPQSPDKNLGRAIYGFLCFDHREVHYFHNELDVKMGYIFADLISLYLIEQLNYTKYSRTAQKAFQSGEADKEAIHA